MKYAKVKSLHKFSNLEETGNFGPKALNNTISKKNEKRFHQKMNCLLEKSQVLKDHQFGFKTSRSTIDALSIVTENVLEAKITNIELIVFFLIFEKHSMQ